MGLHCCLFCYGQWIGVLLLTNLVSFLVVFVPVGCSAMPHFFLLLERYQCFLFKYCRMIWFFGLLFHWGHPPKFWIASLTVFCCFVGGSWSPQLLWNESMLVLVCVLVLFISFMLYWFSCSAVWLGSVWLFCSCVHGCSIWLWLLTGIPTPLQPPASTGVLICVCWCLSSDNCWLLARWACHWQCHSDLCPCLIGLG